MHADDAAVAVRERQFDMFQLALCRLAAELPHRFDHVKHAPRQARMTGREQSAVRRYRESASQARPPSFVAKR